MYCSVAQTVEVNHSFLTVDQLFLNQTALVHKAWESINQKVNKHPKFDDNFDIRRKLERFEYEMNQTLD